MDFMENDNNVITEPSKSYLPKTFLWMFMGLLATGIIAIFSYNTGLVASLLYDGLFEVVCIIELVVVIVFSLLSRKLSATAVGILYFVYAIINGISMSVIFAAFEIESIALVFIASAGLFAIFAFIGYKTNIDLTKIGNILLGVLFVGIIVSLINLFIGNSMIDIILDWVLLLVFFGVTAYDIQKIKNMQEQGLIQDDKLHIYGAMEIYLDFINIFLRLLSIFGKRRD